MKQKVSIYCLNYTDSCLIVFKSIFFEQYTKCSIRVDCMNFQSNNFFLVSRLCLVRILIIFVSVNKQALTTCLINEGSYSHMGMSKFLNFEMHLAQHYQITAVAHQQPVNLDQTASGPSKQISEKIHYPSSNGLCHINQVCPVGLPDLNLSPEEAFGMEPTYVNKDLADKRARFAEARRLRRGIIKNRSMKSGVRTLRSRWLVPRPCFFDSNKVYDYLLISSN